MITAISNNVWKIIRHPLASGATILTTSQYIAVILGFLTNIVAARLLGPANYGQAALVMSFPSLLLSFVSFKSITIATRYISEFRATGQHQKLIGACKLGYGLDLLVAIAVFVVVSLTSWWVTRYIYYMPELSWLMICYATALPFSAFMGTSQAILLSWEKFLWLALSQLFNKGLIFVLVLTLLLLNFGVTGMVMGIAIGQAIAGIVMVIVATYMLHQEGIEPWWKASMNHVSSLWKEFVTFFGWNYLVVTLSGALIQIPLILLGRLHGPEVAGFYRLATTLMTAGATLETSLGKVVYPTLSARWGKQKWVGIHQNLKQWTLRAGIPAGLSLLLVIATLLPLLIPILFGVEYQPMVLGVQIMLVAVAVRIMFFWLNSYYYASDQIGLFAKIYTVYVVLIVVLSWSVIQYWGFLGIAILTATGKIIYTLILTKLAFKKR